MDEPFAGDKKVGKSLTWDLEQRFIAWAVTKVPKGIETYHLTLATIPVSLLIIVFSFFAKRDIAWLWAVSLMVALQWLTDALDGAVGRERNTGLIRWGYYMDHLLDFFFLASVLIGYMILLPDSSKWLFFFVFALATGFMVNSYLVMAACNRFRIAHFGIGPTEVRLLIIIGNSLLVLDGHTDLSDALPYILGVVFIALIVVVYKEQKKLWKSDMESKDVCIED